MTEDILDNIIYALFLHNFEFIDNDKGKESYKEFKENAMKEHCGDCTLEPQPCSRCEYEDYFTQAKLIFSILNDKKIIII